MKKVTLFLCVLVIAFAVIGCGNKGGTSSGPGNNFNATGMPIVNEPITLTVMTMRWGDMGDTFKNNQWLIDLEKRSNVKINWVAVSNNGWDEQRSILLAGGDLPDIFLGSETINDANVVNNPGYFLALDDLIDQYMPNYKRAMSQMPALRAISTYNDGKIYSLSKNLPIRAGTRNHLILNKQWLDRLGLGIPTTLNEFTNVLRAYKTLGVYPISFNGDVHVDFYNPFGITDLYDTLMTIKDGNAFFWPTSNEYKAAMNYARQLWTEGLIDQESFTQDWSMFNGKRMNGQVGTAWEWTHDAAFGSISNQYVAVTPIAGPDGRRYAGGDANGVFAIGRNEALITKDCKHPEAAARWLDEFYDNEASIQNFWGAIGTVISKNSDGTYSLNNPPAGTSADAWYWDQSLRDFGPKYVEQSFNSKIILDPTAGDGMKWEISKLSDPFLMEPFPNLLYTNSELEEISIISTDIRSYISQTRARWITQGGVDAGWDEYLSQLDRMGLARYIKIRMDALARYRAR